jgi:hypothetical protein
MLEKVPDNEPDGQTNPVLTDSVAGGFHDPTSDNALKIGSFDTCAQGMQKMSRVGNPGLHGKKQKSPSKVISTLMLQSPSRP